MTFYRAGYGVETRPFHPTFTQLQNRHQVSWDVSGPQLRVGTGDTSAVDNGRVPIVPTLCMLSAIRLHHSLGFELFVPGGRSLPRALRDRGGLALGAPGVRA